ncbi:MAG: ribonuclease Z [Clostridiaceae bacterium]
MVDAALLGTVGGMPMPGRFLSAMLIRYKGRKILTDCGEGTQVSMRILGWGFKSLDIICITHGHGDHTVGLPGLLSTLGNSGRTEPITIIGPRGIGEIVNGLRVIAPYLPYEIKIIEAPKKDLNFCLTPAGLAESEETGEFTISALELDHTWPCLGYSFYVHRRPVFDPVKAEENCVPKELWNRLQSGEAPISYRGRYFDPSLVLGPERPGIKISYITDSRPTEEIPEFISGSDVFICEGAYGDDINLEKAIAKKHMTFTEAAKLACEGGVKELILTHFSPSVAEPEVYLDRASMIFNNITIGKDRMLRYLTFTGGTKQ